ncbi:MAG: hypothetical protein JST27_05655 [Bacteroidetes bacterium]|nr:hypothetical protein [Bacteroidota bacterium]
MHHRIEVALLLRLPEPAQQIETCRASIIPYLEGAGAENIALLPNGLPEEAVAELTFCFECPISLDCVLVAIVQTGAQIVEQYLMLPSSMSGIASAYDARDFGDVVTNAVKYVKGVADASVNSDGMLRIQCRTSCLDELLEQVVATLINIKKQ